MLFASINPFFFILFFVSVFSPYAQAENEKDSTYRYVPQEVITGSGYQDEKDKKLFDASLNETQRQGLSQGQKFGKDFSSKLQKLGINKDAEKLVTAQKKLIGKMVQEAGEKLKIENKSTTLYYFISFSMNDALIKAYLSDAMWNGGILVLRGVKRGETLSQFLKNHILPLIKYQGVHARIEINPNSFEEYDINLVPTILITEKDAVKKGCQCVVREGSKTAYSYQRCQKKDPSSYWKISGNLTSLWALTVLKEAGAPAEPYIERLRKRYQSDQREQKIEKGINFDWQKVPQPHSDEFLQQFLKSFGLSQTNTGTIVYQK
jgi:type-F conjugative transfer system pilin assembly protein TrbC